MSAFVIKVRTNTSAYRYHAIAMSSLDAWYHALACHGYEAAITVLPRTGPAK